MYGLEAGIGVVETMEFGLARLGSMWSLGWNCSGSWCWTRDGLDVGVGIGAEAGVDAVVGGGAGVDGEVGAGDSVVAGAGFGALLYWSTPTVFKNEEALAIDESAIEGIEEYERKRKVLHRHRRATMEEPEKVIRRNKILFPELEEGGRKMSG
jgi:hypothetical protein